MAGCYDRSWRVDSKARGTRSQFRLNTEGLLPFKRSYPVHLTDAMDAVPSTQADLCVADRISPARGNRTRAVREYEQAIDELKKENFDLKLRIFLLEETLNKNYLKIKGSGGENNPENDLQVVVELQFETQNLKDELIKKDQSLEEALLQVEKYVCDLKELQEKFILQKEKIAEQEQALIHPQEEIAQQREEIERHLKVLTHQQEEIATQQLLIAQQQADIEQQREEVLQREEIVKQLPSPQEVRALLEENESLLKENDALSNLISEKDQKIQEALGQNDEMSKKNADLETKVKKRTLAIQGLVQKYNEDVQMIPKGLRSVVSDAVQAASENNQEGLITAVDNFKIALSKIKSKSTVRTVHSEEQRKDTHMENSSRKSARRNLSLEDQKRTSGSMTEFVEQIQEKSGLKAFMNDINDISSSPAKEKAYLSKSSESLHESERFSSSNSSSKKDTEQLENLMKENEGLKLDNEEKLKTISNQSLVINELEERTIHLQSELMDAVSKVKNLEAKFREEKSKRTSSLSMKNSSVQTAVQWHLMQSKISDKLLQNAGLSDNIDDLKEEILTLLLVIEQKDKEISDLEESLQQHMEMIANKKEDTSTAPDMTYLAERNELHQRLADCSAINNDLLKHLRSLESFMENLLQHKNIDSSLESISQTTDFLSQLTTCLDETVKLSAVLSDNLSVCENSRLFDPNEFSVNNEFSQVEYSSYQPRDKSRLSGASNIESRLQGRHNLQTSEQNTVGTGKRRLSFSTMSPKSAADMTLVNSENVVVLGTSNNEDLILLLNEKGDPEDVLIRNNHSHLNNSVPNNDQLSWRCWDSLKNQWGAENFVVNQQINNWYASEMLNSKKGYTWFNPCPSSDSDIWSEPDRDVSLQRIGIDVQKSPVTQRSPRRSRIRGQRTTDELSSQKHESSSSFTKLHSWSKRRKSSDTSKLSLTYKKCISQSQQTDNYSKDDQMKYDLQKEIDSLLQKCNSQEGQMEEMENSLKSKVSLIKNLMEERNSLSYYVNQLKEEIACLKNEQKVSNQSVNDETNKLREYIQNLEGKLKNYDSECNGLKTALFETKSKLSILDTKCAEYEEKFSKSFEDNNKLIERLKELDGEKEKLVKEVERLLSEKNDLLNYLNSERESKKSMESNELLKTELSETKLKLATLDKKCSEYENVLSKNVEDKEKSFERLKSLDVEKENLRKKVATLISENKNLLENLNSERESRKSMESNELLKTELSETKLKLATLDKKCSEYENVLSKNLEDKEKSIEQFKSLGAEKENLRKKVATLISENTDLLDNLNSERESRIKNEKEKHDLIIKSEESLNTISCLKLSNKKLEEAQISLLQEKEIAENNLQSFNSLCNDLKEELEDMEKTLKDMESKCAIYEEKLSEASRNEEGLVKKLSGFKTALFENLNNLNLVFNQYFSIDKNMLKDSEVDLSSRLLSELDKNKQTERLLEFIVSLNDILKQKINILSEQLHAILSSLQVSKSFKEEYEHTISSTNQALEEKERENECLITRNQQLISEIEKEHQELEEKKFLNKEYQSKIISYQQQLEVNQNEMASMKDHCKKLQNGIFELQDIVKNKEKSLEATNLNCESLQKNVDALQKKIENDGYQLNLKDDDITHLQERIFNLQTQINGLLSDKAGTYSNQMSHLKSKSSSEEILLTAPEFRNSLPSLNISSESLVINSTSERMTGKKDSKDDLNVSLSSGYDLNVSKGSEESLLADIEPVRIPNENIKLSMSSTSADVENSSKERYAKKLKSLNAKLLISEKRIEILEKGKNDLREKLSAQISKNERTQNLSDEINSLQIKLASMKEKLEAKVSFIKDLKNELQNSYNLLMEKNKQIDELSTFKRNAEIKLEASVDDRLQNRYSDPLHRSTESNIKELNKHKWELIQDIFKQQMQFYKRKNIHLGHFEKFKNHVEKLRNLQISPVLFKSESEPFLNVSMTANHSYVEKCDQTLKNLRIELEIDIECFQNINIFLKRFFIPLILQDCQCMNLSPRKDDDSSEGAKGISIKSLSDEMLAKEMLPVDFAQAMSMEALPNFKEFPSNDRLSTIASVVSHKVDSLESALTNVKSVFQEVNTIKSLPQETARKGAAKSLLLKLSKELKSVLEKSDEISHLNSSLKSLEIFPTIVDKSPSKQDMSDRESLLSEETITLSHSRSLSPLSFEEIFPSKLIGTKLKKQREAEDNYEQKAAEIKEVGSKHADKVPTAGGSQESIFQRSHFSSPDLGIESDPNHESSAPEQMEKEEFFDGSSKTSKRHDMGSKMGLWPVDKLQPASTYGQLDRSNKLKDEDSDVTVGDTLHAIGHLKQYQLLKKEVQESLVGIKVVLSRTNDGLHHIIKYTSPRKGIECATFKAIRDESLNIEVCLKEAFKLVDGFWIAPCPSVEELKSLIQQNQELQCKLESLREAKRKQQSYFEQAMDNLKKSEVLRGNMEKNISRKLVKTKKVIREVEVKMLQQNHQTMPLLPKYPVEESTCQKKL